MACALPVLVQTGGDGIPDFLLCPICLELPEKVFQCKEGHTLCGSCYVKYVDCPNCRSRFDKAEPIRCRYFEGLLDKVVKVDSAYKINGCNEKPTRELVHVHQTKCLFNIDKFGKMVNLCKLIDYKTCDFRFNTGNIEDAVEHFLVAHSCVLIGSGPFQMKLTGFKESTEAEPCSNCFWTPVISDLKEQNCFLLTCAMLNICSTAASLSCFSLTMPKSPELSETLTIECSVASDKDCQSELGFFQKSILLGNVESLLPNNLPCSIQIKNLRSYLTEDGSLLVNCMVRESGTNSRCKTDAKIKKLERIVCSNTSVSNVIPPSCNQDKVNDSSGCGIMDSKKEEIIDMAILTARNITNGIMVEKPETEMNIATSELQYEKILVENLPDFVAKNHVKNVFTQFGEVKCIQMLKQNPNGAYLFFKSKSKTSADACLVEFVRQVSVDHFLNSKWRPFLKKDGKRHQLKVKILRFYTSAPDKWTKFDLDYWQAYEYSLTNPKLKGSFKLDRNDVLGFIDENYPKYTLSDKYFKGVCGIWFFIAAAYGTIDCIKYCIEKGMDINSIGFKHKTMSCMNVLAGTLFDKDKEIGLEKIKLLVESGADIHFKDEFGRSLLHMSVIWGSNDDAVKFFLEKGLDVNAVGKGGQTPLHSALLSGSKVQFSMEKVKLLLDHGASLDIKDYRGRIPMDLIKLAPVEHREKIKEMFGNHLKRVQNLN